MVLDFCRLKEILIRGHSGHQGVSRTINRIKRIYWWPRLSSDVENLIKNCELCQCSERTTKTHETHLMPIPLNGKAEDSFCMDITGPSTEMPYKYLLVLVDIKSRWPEVMKLNSIKADDVIFGLRKKFNKIGWPKKTLSDNGSQFVSVKTEHFFTENGITHIRSPIYSPQSNGLVERMNKTIKQKINEGIENNKEPNSVLRECLFNYRMTPHTLTGISPYELFFGRPPREPLCWLENGAIKRMGFNSEEIT